METRLKLTAYIWPEGDVFVSQCREYCVASYGNTIEEALKMLREAVEFYLEPPLPTVFPEPVTFDTPPSKVYHFEVSADQAALVS